MSDTTATRTCKTCSRDFTPTSRHANCPACRGQATKKPCPHCGTPIFRAGKACGPCTAKNSRGENSATWKGGRTRHAKGYIMIKAPEHPRASPAGYVLEHILVMESHLGRPLRDGETVHHLYGVRDDNRIEHLELWTRPPCSGIRARDALTAAQQILDDYPNLTPAAASAAHPQGDSRWTATVTRSTYIKNGYVMTYVAPGAHPRGIQVFEHILVMENLLGRYLAPGENVHHLNGQTCDNRPENLELWTRPQPTGVRAADLVRWAHETLARYGDCQPEASAIDLAS